MKNIDVELIHRVLDGDDTAFSELVKKHQKSVHALVWRKIGDFHIAEEITQDTFLKAYQGLATLKKPQSFASWLYVIAANHCRTWLRKKRLRTQSLEETSSAELERATYSGYVIEENEQTAVETRREAVKKLLAKLQESERTVLTLHYFGEMSSVEIGAFLGVSENTIRSRLRRAQQRLKKEAPMIREVLDNFQITPHLSENIMREISRLKPAVPSGGRPLTPWAIAASTVALVFVMLGANNQYLSRFQKPYSFDAMSEMTIELIEAPVVLNLAAKPDVRNQFGNADTRNKNNEVNQKPDATLFPSASGRILDETGEPVSGIKIALRPVIDGNGAWFPIRERNAASSQAESDASGHFTIASVIDGPVLLSLFPFDRSDVRILKVQIGGSFFYPSGMHDRGIVFATSPGRRIENIEVIVRQPHIRCRVQRIDGTPIVNTRVKRRLRTVSLYGNSSSDGSAHTDAEGYFTHYAERDLEGPTVYMLSITYQGQTVNVKPIILKPGDQTHEVVLTFEDMTASPLRPRRGDFASASASTRGSRPVASASLQDVWVVRPENGHAYKRIQCADWEDAQAQAAAEGGYLVTINDEAEQKWLQAVFGGQPSWIGLNDIAQEGQWIWDNGEPVTYTNWGLQEPGDTSLGEEDYVIIGPSGKWEDFGPGHGGISLIRTALIEKENLPVKQ
ncbi:hypothetical protein C6503_21065 [Candidatus Poribacteria bacterium]|nr:MAG: hypothetical protein C6503_21065 [Candidatus Poribacteria bacterium]